MTAPFVLWAEDSPADQELVRCSVETFPASIDLEFVRDGVELVSRLRTVTPALAVLDLKMPRKGGIEALEDVRLLPTPVAVVVFSSSSQPAELEACRRLGVLDVVRKPLDFLGFEAAVHRILAYVGRLHASQLSAEA